MSRKHYVRVTQSLVHSRCVSCIYQMIFNPWKLLVLPPIFNGCLFHWCYIVYPGYNLFSFLYIYFTVVLTRVLCHPFALTLILRHTIVLTWMLRHTIVLIWMLRHTIVLTWMLRNTFVKENYIESCYCIFENIHLLQKYYESKKII